MSTTGTVVRRGVSAALVAATLGSAVVAGPVFADPQRLAQGPLSIAVPGWAIDDPAAENRLTASAVLPGKNWESLIELRSSITPNGSLQDAARTIVLAAPQTPGYSTTNARVVGLTTTPTTVSGIPAARATATVEITDGPVKADRLHVIVIVIVIDTVPRSYFLSAVPLETPDRIRHADNAEKSLTAQR